MRKLNKFSEKIVIIMFVSFTLFTSGFLISLIVIPFLHPEVETSHLQIYITEDADFDKYNFPGTGTPADPFLIENFTYQEDGLVEIRIFGVSKHFVIRNNVIIANRFDEGIRIGNAPIVSIINNVVYGSAHLHNWNTGIAVYNVNECNIINNSIFFEEKGIRISGSSNCSVKNNKLIKNGRNIEIIDSPNILIENNSLVFKTQTGYGTKDSIYVQNSDNISIINNQLDKSGIFFNDGSIKTAIIENNFIDGLKIGFFRNNTNLLINSTTEFGQILLADCKNCSLYNLNMSKRNVGIAIYNSNLINCSYCNLSSNLYAGLYIYESTNVTISESIFLSNDIGTRVKYSNNIRFLNNVFQDNSCGIYLSHSNCIFINNSFINNSIDIHTYDY